MKREGGYLLIDNRHAPSAGPLVLPGGREVIDPGTSVYESATYTCSHCSAIVVRNPTRTRERAWCRGCDHVVCDPCGLRLLTSPCLPMAKRLEEGQTAAIRALGRG